MVHQQDTRVRVIIIDDIEMLQGVCEFYLPFNAPISESFLAV